MNVTDWNVNVKNVERVKEIATGIGREEASVLVDLSLNGNDADRGVEIVENVKGAVLGLENENVDAAENVLRNPRLKRLKDHEKKNETGTSILHRSLVLLKITRETCFV